MPPAKRTTTSTAAIVPPHGVERALTTDVLRAFLIALLFLPLGIDPPTSSDHLGHRRARHKPRGAAV